MRLAYFVVALVVLLVGSRLAFAESPDLGNCSPDDLGCYSPPDFAGVVAPDMTGQAPMDLAAAGKDSSAAVGDMATTYVASGGGGCAVGGERPFVGTVLLMGALVGLLARRGRRA